MVYHVKVSIWMEIGKQWCQDMRGGLKTHLSCGCSANVNVAPLDLTTYYHDFMEKLWFLATLI